MKTKLYKQITHELDLKKDPVVRTLGAKQINRMSHQLM